MAEPDKRSVTLEELLVSSHAQTDVLAKLLIEKGLITRQEVYAEDFRGEGDASKAAESDTPMSIAEHTGGSVSTHRKVPNDRGVKAIAIFKLAKGTLLLALATGALALLHSDLTNVVMQWVDALQVDPDNKYVQRLLETVMSVDDRKIKALSAGTFLFAGLFLTEGIGLLLQKNWAAYLTIIATASFVPLEVFELAKKFSVAKVVVIGINVLVVCYLIARLGGKRHQTSSPD